MTSDQPAVTLPVQRTCPFSPPPEYERMRADAPVSRVGLPGGRSAWVLTRHEDARAMLTDRRFSSDRTKPGFPLLVADARKVLTGAMPSLIGMDPPEHGEVRPRRAVVGQRSLR